ncbi:MAG: hypothetical protein NTU83_01050, partial [Candidatus Hydrogenedentes bacterium]|nr:hypothetical protein [Candidatus Hydrogenedentota bacterium]
LAVRHDGLRLRAWDGHGARQPFFCARAEFNHAALRELFSMLRQTREHNVPFALPVTTAWDASL